MALACADIRNCGKRFKAEAWLPSRTYLEKISVKIAIPHFLKMKILTKYLTKRIYEAVQFSENTTLTPVQSFPRAVFELLPSHAGTNLRAKMPFAGLQRR